MKIKVNKKGKVTIEGVDINNLTSILCHAYLGAYDRKEKCPERHYPWYKELIEKIQKIQEDLRIACVKTFHLDN